MSDSVALSVKSVPTNRFGDCDITLYAFGENAKKYGEFLRDAGIEEMPIDTANLQGKPFARKVWFRWLGDVGSSGLDCGSGGLRSDGIRVRGVRESAEGAAKNLELYLSEVKEAREEYIGRLKVIRDSIDKELRTSR